MLEREEASASAHPEPSPTPWRSWHLASLAQCQGQPRWPSLTVNKKGSRGVPWASLDQGQLQPQQWPAQGCKGSEC